jgi:hypothetical protein
MAAGWMDAYRDDPDEDQDLIGAPSDTPPEPGPILRCRHCGGYRLRLRSSSSDSEAVQFACLVCGKCTTHHLPYGYDRLFHAIT